MGGQMVSSKRRIVDHFVGQRNEPRLFQGWTKARPRDGQGSRLKGGPNLGHKVGTVAKEVGPKAGLVGGNRGLKGGEISAPG